MTMLYVFLVDTGAMLTFEMELAMESVETLMKSIASMLMIPVEKQVLLMQGGEALDPSHRICNYSSAGTEHNPIFLFSKTTIESATPPSPSLNLGSEMSLKEEVEMSLRLPPTYETLVSRAKLAMRFQEMGCDLLQNCISLINEQHLQQQGWLSVVANLEKIASTFETRGSILEQNYKEFLELGTQYKSLLDSFPDVIKQLSELPLFPCLIKDDVKLCLSTDKDQRLSLLDWINAQDEKNSLEDMVGQCVDALNQFQNSSLYEIQEDKDQVLGEVSRKNIKEIGGLEERLDMLSKLCEQARNWSQEQSDMAQGFAQNQERAQNIGDASVLPDLCSSHQAQLSLMMHNHSQLRDIRRRCAKAKDELSGNLHARLKWVMVIEKKICDCDSKLVMYHESMKRMKKRMEILEQVSVAPRIYALTVKEVVRRREFASQFSKWARAISRQSNGVYKEEIASRHGFLHFIGNHFLKNLFSGIEEIPPQFATFSDDFDADLPSLTSSELQELMNCAPRLFDQHSGTTETSFYNKDTETFTSGKSFSCSDLSSVKDFVLKSSFDETDSKEDNRSKELCTESKITDSMTDRTDECVVVEENDNTGDLKDSSCDTIGAEAKEISRTGKMEPEVISFSISTKENLLMNLNELRQRLNQFSVVASSWDTSMKQYLDEQLSVFQVMKQKERNKIVEGEFDGDTSKNVKELTDNLDSLTKKVSFLNSENESLRKEIKAKDVSFSEKELRYREEVKRHKQHALELESAKETFEAEQQIRFNNAVGRVMKEKEMSLKKSDEQLNYFKLLQQKNDEKLQVLFNEKETLRQEKDEYAKKLLEALSEVNRRKMEMENYITETQKRLEEKEREFHERLENEKKEAAMMPEVEEQKTDSTGSDSGQMISELVMDRLHKRIKHLEEENGLLKDRLKAGSDGEDKILFVELQQALDEKCKECDSLRAELDRLQSQKPRNSQAALKDLARGETVEVYYNEQYEMYMISSEGETLFFVHPESLVNFDLADTKSSRTFQAQVLDKEYCLAKKANNRFKVRAGTKFYRVKIRPLDPID